MAIREEIANLRVDENLTLTMHLTDGSPMVNIINNGTGKKKAVSPSWFLEEGRELHIKTGPKSSASYTVAQLDKALSQLITHGMTHPAVKPMIWQTFRALTDILHQPKMVIRENEFNMLPEEKRFSLWLGWVMPGAPMGRLIPCFPVQEKEREVLLSGAEGNLDEGLKMESQEVGVQGLQKRGIITKLMRVNPQRWYTPVMTSAAAAVLGMVEPQNPTEDTSLAHKIWGQRGEVQVVGSLDRSEMAPYASDLCRRIVAFIRHFYDLTLIEVERTIDGHDLLLKEGFGRRERVEFPVGVLGKQVYQVTVYVQKEGGLGAILYHPVGNSMLKDWILRYPLEVYSNALKNDSCSSMEDPNVTLLNILRAVRFQAWMERILRITRNSLPGGM
ncbi:hypothetical protein TheveDRAFT_0347 [Thermanaerovibrio velox DSM 12556]|uniref:Uncharacterized protein n=1 Tax=Thermanaerovibrio velox DSM 12556 TaxID=926567 RepID=H0UPA3_9BACT|nr:hypothetical protein [Thermanaerovibrio velox]EHM09516.1 hypothetical protein TheveDRAFT_0347 [Thermanaerovibrio velox DSM 12556]